MAFCENFNGKIYLKTMPDCCRNLIADTIIFLSRSFTPDNTQYQQQQQQQQAPLIIHALIKFGTDPNDRCVRLHIQPPSPPPSLLSRSTTQMYIVNVYRLNVKTNV